MNEYKDRFEFRKDLLDFDNLNSEDILLNGFEEAKRIHNKIGRVFDDNYVPDPLPFRDSQIKQIRNKIAQAGEFFLYGKSCTGKTVTIKYIFNLLSTKLNITDTKFIYHNCRFTTTTQILDDVAKRIDLELPRNRSLEYRKQMILDQCRTLGIERIFLCLDDIQHFEDLYQKNGKSILIFFTDENRIFKIIPVTTDKDFLSDAPEDEISRFNPDRIDFLEYSYPETLGIIAQRCALAFEEQETITNEEIKNIARVTYNVRDGIRLLKNIYSYKKKHNITDNLEIQEIESQAKTMNKEQELDQFVDGALSKSPNLFNAVLIITTFLTDTSSDEFTIADLEKTWQASLKTPRKYHAILKYVKSLQSQNYVKIKRKKGSTIIYEPLFDLKMYLNYFDSMLFKKKIIHDIENKDKNIEKIKNYEDNND